MSGLRSTRWRVGLGLLACAVVAGGWLSLRSSSRAAASEGTRPEAATEALRARIRAPADRSELAAAGEQVLSGRIVDGDGIPVGGVLVSASEAAVAPPPLGALSCGCANGCETKLLQCGYTHAAEALLARAQAQTDAPLEIARTTSAADGTFTLRGLEREAYQLWAESERGVALARAEGGAKEVEVVLSSGQVLRGVVQDEDGEPLAEAVVSALHHATGRTHEALTGPDGAYQLGPVLDGPHTVIAAHVELLPGAQRPEDRIASPRGVIVLHRPRRAEVQVLRGGEPAAGVEVTLAGDHLALRLLTSEAGTVVFDRLPPSYFLVSADEGGLTAAESVHLSSPVQAPVVLQLRRAASLSGRVIDPKGAPIAGAELRVELEAPGSRPERQATSDAGGRFHLASLPPGQVRVWVTARGYLNLRGAQTALLVGGEEATLALTLQPGVRLAGTVVDLSGRPVKDARVTAAAGGHGDATSTSEEGAFEVFLGDGDAELKVTHPDYRPLSKRVPLPANDVRLVLDPGHAVRGQVLNVDGGPAAGARIAVETRLAQHATQDGREGITDAAGNFHIRGVPPGEVFVIAVLEVSSGGNYRVGTAKAVLPQASPLTIRLLAGETLTGRVVDQHGQPAEGVQLAALLEGLDQAKDSEIFEALQGGAPFGRATSDAQGRFEIEMLRPGRYEIRVRSEDFESSRTQGSPGTPLEVVVRRLPVVKGRVLGADGAPLRVFSVAGQPFESPDGRFSLPAHSRGQVPLEIEARDHAPWQRALESGERDVDLGDVRLTRGTTVRGRVIDAKTGRPIAGALVNVGEVAATAGAVPLAVHSGAVRTGGEGTFELRHVAEDRPLALFAAHPDYLAERAPLAADVVLRLRPAAVVFGRLDGRVPGFVRLTGAQDEQGTIEFDGTFRVGGLAAGEYQVELAGPMAHAYRAQKIVLGEGEHRALQPQRLPGADLVVELAMEGELPYVYLEREGSEERIEAARRDGPRREFLSVPPGRYRLVMYGYPARSDQPMRGEVPVTIGDTPQPVLRLSWPSDARPVEGETTAQDQR